MVLTVASEYPAEVGAEYVEVFGRLSAKKVATAMPGGVPGSRIGVHLRRIENN